MPEYLPKRYQRDLPLNSRVRHTRMPEIRFYEDEGLGPSRQAGRTGSTSPPPPSDQEVIRGRRLGFSIPEIRQIIRCTRNRPARSARLKLIRPHQGEARAVAPRNAAHLEETLPNSIRPKNPVSNGGRTLGVSTLII